MELLRVMRQRGYTVRDDGGTLSVMGPTPRDPERAQETLRANKVGMLKALRVERHPAVRDAIGMLGAVLVDVR